MFFAMARIQHSWEGLLWFLIAVPTFMTAFISVDASNRSTSLLEMSSGYYHSSNSSVDDLQRGRPVCDPIRARGPLRRTSCEEAATKVPSGSTVVRFARRGLTIHEVQIPRRYSSCTS